MWRLASAAKKWAYAPEYGNRGQLQDNAMAESFFATLECELIDRRSWKTHTEARLAIFTWELRPGTTRTGGTQALGQISPINFERLNVKNKENAKTQKPASSVDNSEPVQTEMSIDCDRQVNLIENTQKIKNL